RKDGYSIKIGRNMDMTLCLSQNHYPGKYCRKAELGHGVSSIACRQYRKELESDIMTHSFIGSRIFITTIKCTDQRPFISNSGQIARYRFLHVITPQINK